MLPYFKAFKPVNRRFRQLLIGFISCVLSLLLSEPSLKTLGQPATEISQPTPSPSNRTRPDQRVLVAEVVVQGVSGKLQEIVYQAATTKPGRVTTRSQLQNDINAIFKTGWFSNVKAEPEDTPKGVRVTFVVQLNPVLRRVNITSLSNGQPVLPTSVVSDIFRSQYDSVLNLQTLQAGIGKLNQWYQTNGYVLAKVADNPKIAKDGTVTLQIDEGVIESVQVQFVNSDKKPTNTQGKPIVGKVPASVILQVVESKPGMVFNRAQAEKDLKRVFGLGIFNDVKLALKPGKNPKKAAVVLNVQEISRGTTEELVHRAERVIRAEKDLQQARSRKDPIAEATALRILAQAQSDVALYQTALKLAQTSRDRAGEAEALKGLAYLYNYEANRKTNNNGNNEQSFDKEKKKQAVSTYQAALKIYRSLNNDTQSAIVLNNVGYLFQELEDYPAAIAIYRQAVPLFQSLKQPFWQALALGNLAANYRKMGEIDQSLTIQQQALSLWKILREQPKQLESSSLFSRVDQPSDRQSNIALSWGYSSKTGFFSDFKFYIGTNDLQKSSLDDVRWGEAMTLVHIGGIYQAVGDYQQALYAFKAALPFFQTPATTQALIQNGSFTSEESKKFISKLIPELIDAGASLLMSSLYTDIGWQKQAQNNRDRALSKGRTILEKTLEAMAMANKTSELNSLLPMMRSLFNSLIANARNNSFDAQLNQTLIDWVNQSMPILQQLIAKQPEYKTQWQYVLPWMDVFYNYTQGEELAKTNKFQQAVEVYRQALAQWKTLSPRDLQAATIRVNFHTTGTNFTKTSTIAALDLMPLVPEIFDQARYVYHAKTYTALGKALLALGKTQEAIEAHQQAVQMLQTGRPDVSKTPVRARPTHALDQFGRTFWTRFWTKTPDAATANALFQLGKAYAANRQSSLALDSYSRALPLWRKADQILPEAD
jgi:tetratricopeptide (TPR) repeat protein